MDVLSRMGVGGLAHVELELVSPVAGTAIRSSPAVAEPVPQPMPSPPLR